MDPGLFSVLVDKNIITWDIIKQNLDMGNFNNNILLSQKIYELAIRNNYKFKNIFFRNIAQISLDYAKLFIKYFSGLDIQDTNLKIWLGLIKG